MKQWLTANRSFIRSILESLDTPVSLSVWLKVKYREWDQLATSWVDPLHYPEGVFSALAYARDVQAVDLLRKAPLPTTFSRKAAALAAWNDAETRCFWTNERLLSYLTSRATPDEVRFSKFLGRVKRRLTRWMGPLPEDFHCAFGPGTCVEYKGSNPTVVDKLWLTPTTTPEALPYFEAVYWRSLWGSARLQAGLALPDTSPGNRLTTVPKDGKVDRPISIEPVGNLWLQLGVGRHLKRRLRLVGLPRFADTHRDIIPGLTVSYEDAQSVHRRLITEASVTESFATIDLSSASDTISRELVRQVLPDDWFAFLDDIRSRKTWVPSQDGLGRYVLLEKFSSMGNGFTFELETFIFLALLSEAFDLTPGVNLWVFGDDIIIPTDYYDQAVHILSLSGFVPNVRKSYGSGPFRESCGGNAHSGLEVTPVRIKDTVDSIPAWVALHNALYRKGFGQRVLSHILRRIPRKCHVYGPSRVGDVVLHGRPWRVRRQDGWDYARVMKFKPEHVIPLDRWSPELSLCAAVLGVPMRVVRRGTRVTFTGYGKASVS